MELPAAPSEIEIPSPLLLFTWFRTTWLPVVRRLSREIPLSGGGGATTPLPLPVTTLPLTTFLLEFLILIPTLRVASGSPPELSWTMLEFTLTQLATLTRMPVVWFSASLPPMRTPPLWQWSPSTSTPKTAGRYGGTAASGGPVSVSCFTVALSERLRTKTPRSKPSIVPPLTWLKTWTPSYLFVSTPTSGGSSPGGPWQLPR